MKGKCYEIFPSNKKIPKLFNWERKRKHEVKVRYGKPISVEGKTIDQLTQEIYDAILGLSYA